VALFAFEISNTLVNLLEPEKPHQIVGKNLFTSVSNKVFKRIDFYLQPVKTTTDYGYLMDDFVSVTDLQYSNHIEFLDFV
jgi:hypothetical protein